MSQPPAAPVPDVHRFASRWLAESLDLTPLTADDRRRVVDGIGTVYRAAGRLEPDQVVWVRSPVELGRAYASRSLIRRAYGRATRRRGLLGWGRELLGTGLWLAWRVLLTLLAAGGLIAVYVLFARMAGPYPPGFWQTRQGWRTAGGFGAGLVVMFVLIPVVLAIPAMIVENFPKRQRHKYAHLDPQLSQAVDESLSGAEVEVMRRDDSALWSEVALRSEIQSFWHTFWSTVGVPPVPPYDRWRKPAFDRGWFVLGQTYPGGAEFGWPAADGTSERAADVLGALRAIRRAFGWTPYHGLVVICEPPREIGVEWVAGRPRLHSVTGPAVVWGDGTAAYFLSGVRVPEHLYRAEVSVREINWAGGNSEVRRVLIERMGWSQYLERAECRLIASVPDPGNGDRRLALYDVPNADGGIDRTLLMVNGSPDRSGREREYAELVPGHFDDPVEAAAWQYGCPVEVYRTLARRT
jgi:hypothetical protein